MNPKKSFKVYYLLVCEGTTEFTIFAYLTKNKFRHLFDKSNIRFSNKVDIIKDENQIIFQGKLNGAGSIGDFRAKYSLIKSKYPGEKIFFLLDKDLDDSPDIETLITQGGDIIQFVEHNSEYLLLKFAGKNPREPSDFNNLGEFRDYSEAEFEKEFNKKASDLKDADLDLIFGTATNEEVSVCFSELFATLTEEI